LTSIYDATGAIRVTVSDGVGFKGLYAPDGSWYVTLAPGGSYVGAYAPDGSLYVTEALVGSPSPVRAPDGSLYVNTTGLFGGGLFVSGLGATISLSVSLIAEDASVGSVVGTLSVLSGSGVYTFSITADPDSKFAIDGDDLKLAATVDYETATSHSVTVEADNGVDPPLSRTFTINVTDVEEPEITTAIEWGAGNQLEWGSGNTITWGV
jgi:hypothetical protein